MKKKPLARSAEKVQMHLTIKVSPHVLAVLESFQKKFMPAELNAANAACYILHTALMDYDHLMARAIQVELYSKSEGMMQQEYQESVLRMKFPRGNVHRPKTPS